MKYLRLPSQLMATILEIFHSFFLNKCCSETASLWWLQLWIVSQVASAQTQLSAVTRAAVLELRHCSWALAFCAVLLNYFLFVLFRLLYFITVNKLFFISFFLSSYTINTRINKGTTSALEDTHKRLVTAIWEWDVLLLVKIIKNCDNFNPTFINS